jgi:hypothetical protein
VPLSLGAWCFEQEHKVVWDLKAAVIKVCLHNITRDQRAQLLHAQIPIPKRIGPCFCPSLVPLRPSELRSSFIGTTQLGTLLSTLQKRYHVRGFYDSICSFTSARVSQHFKPISQVSLEVPAVSSATHRSTTTHVHALFTHCYGRAAAVCHRVYLQPFLSEFHAVFYVCYCLLARSLSPI